MNTQEPIFSVLSKDDPCGNPCEAGQERYYVASYETYENCMYVEAAVNGPTAGHETCCQCASL